MSTWADVGKALAAAAKACSPLSRSGGEPEREPDDTELAVLNALSVELREKYDPAAHEQHFRAIHEAFFPGQPFAAVSANWRTVGFQSDNPVSDLRGAGVLGLKQLRYFCEKYPERSVAVRKRRRAERAALPSADARADRAYPWGAVGMNITRMVAEVFDVVTAYGAPGGFATSSRCFWPVLREASFVCEVYCAVFEFVDAQFEARQLGYMDFPALLKEAKAVVLTQLQSCCDAHAVSVFERDRYYASPLPLESVRLGLGLAPALAAAPPLPVAGIGAMGGAAATA